MMTRKQFLRSALEISAAALGLTMLHACSNTYGSSTGSSPPANGNCLQNGTTTTIAANHGHVLVVSKDDVAAATDKTYDIRGTATHTHSVTITSDMFDQLAGDHAIMTTSTVTESHSHAIMVACA